MSFVALLAIAPALLLAIGVGRVSQVFMCMLKRLVGRSVTHALKSRNLRFFYQKSSTNLIFHSFIHPFIDSIHS